MVGKSKEVLMATVKEVYELLKKKKAAGEKIGMFGESLIEFFEKEKEPSTTKEIHVSFIKNNKRETNENT